MLVKLKEIKTNLNVIREFGYSEELRNHKAPLK